MIHLLVVFRLATADGAEVSAPSAPVELAEPRWIKYRVTPGEQWVDVADRFGVTVDELLDWNGRERPLRRLRPGKRLKIRAHRDPPPRERQTHVVERGETWRDIAIAHQIDSRKLRSYNWKTKQLRAGDELSFWVDPGLPQTIGLPIEEPMAELPSIADGAKSVGRPQVGRIRHSVRLPESPLYVRGRPRWSWGSSHSLRSLTQAVFTFRERTGYRGDIVIGSISRKGGRSFPPHNSHQSGRDVDIRLPLRPGVGAKQNPHPNEVDWPAAWALVEALIDTEQVQLILLEEPLQRRLYEAARWAGVSEERLSGLIRWADDGKWSHAIVRHADGHDGHIHVRFRCGPDEPRCKG